MCCIPWIFNKLHTSLDRIKATNEASKKTSPVGDLTRIASVLQFLFCFYIFAVVVVAVCFSAIFFFFGILFLLGLMCILFGGV